jgi:hypothetical protein
VSSVSGMRLDMVHPSESQQDAGNRWQRDSVDGLRVKPRGSRYGSSTRPASIESLRRMMAEMEEPKAFTRPTVPFASSRGHEQRSFGMYEETGDTDVTGRAVSFETKTFAQSVQESYVDNMATLSTMSDTQRRNRKEQQEAEKARRAGSRLERQAQADEAKIQFGLSSTEKKDRAKRAERMDQQQYDSVREKAVASLTHHARRLLLSNFIALITQVRTAEGS